ncbi:uncharacterized protein LOC129743727 isoform X3 [Uranotaenia lowii]|uniref:uncharacterized protein LOC129743727 isoform X3 n=1 Tax=Uranotaenia lowii TaxID=190385 RepID=UPI00247A245F|nr:uncharacterized protein LOC129743727 isoform X3 [Uranotaenia lowii]
MEVAIKEEPALEIDNFVVNQSTRSNDFSNLGECSTSYASNLYDDPVQEMQRLLAEWDLEILTDRFSTHLIDASVLDYIVDVDIIDLCKDLPIRYRLVLRHKLKEKRMKSPQDENCDPNVFHESPPPKRKKAIPRVVIENERSHIRPAGTEHTATSESRKSATVPSAQSTPLVVIPGPSPAPSKPVEVRPDVDSSGSQLPILDTDAMHKETPQSSSVRKDVGTNQGESDNNQLKTILSSHQIMVENEANILETFQNLQSSMDVCMHLMSEKRGSPSKRTDAAAVIGRVSELFAPIKSFEEMQALEDALNDKGYMEKLIKSLSIICGTNGKACGLDCCYRLIDHFVTREFLVECSWTGGSRNVSGDGPSHASVRHVYDKVAFKCFKNFRTLFMKLVRLADSEFSNITCDEFFKRILRNSRQRLAGSITSRHKKRPSNLKYKSKKSMDQNDSL